MFRLSKSLKENGQVSALDSEKTQTIDKNCYDNYNLDIEEDENESINDNYDHYKNVDNKLPTRNLIRKILADNNDGNDNNYSLEKDVLDDDVYNNSYEMNSDKDEADSFEEDRGGLDDLSEDPYVNDYKEDHYNYLRLNNL